MLDGGSLDSWSNIDARPKSTEGRNHLENNRMDSIEWLGRSVVKRSSSECLVPKIKVGS